MQDAFGNYRVETLPEPATPGASMFGAGTGGGVVITGSASPEGVQTADEGALFWDEVGKVFWVKETDGGNTGWWQIV